MNTPNIVLKRVLAKLSLTYFLFFGVVSIYCFFASLEVVFLVAIPLSLVGLGFRSVLKNCARGGAYSSPYDWDSKSTEVRIFLACRHELVRRPPRGTRGLWILFVLGDWHKSTASHRKAYVESDAKSK